MKPIFSKMPLNTIPTTAPASNDIFNVSNRGNTSKTLFFPTLTNAKSIWFWFSMAVFLSSCNSFSQFQYLSDWTQAFGLFLKNFMNNFCIIFGTVGYLHVSAEALQKLSLKGQLLHITLINLLMTPLMSLVAKIILFMMLEDPQLFQGILIEIVTNTLLAVLVTALLAYYFATQHHAITATQHRYQQKLLEQNAQLKNRITPHFFFNMLNTVQCLIETEPQRASDIIANVSKLYRLSFNEPREVPLTDEIALCEQYLSIEKYRFADRLQVTWELPDEDTLYDMVITSLTLQMLIEKMITSVVELTNKTITIHIVIGWENNLVNITLITTLPETIYRKLAGKDTQLTQKLSEMLSFAPQQDNLQRHFGKTASITYHIAAIPITPAPATAMNALVIKVRYVLIDVG